MSEDRKKRNKSSGVNTQDDTDANGKLDSPAAEQALQGQVDGLKHDLES
jgi:hypothetical protein